MQTIDEATRAFLANKRIAVTGVTRKPQGHGANTVFKRLQDPLMQGYPAALQEGPIRNLVRQGMLERVFRLRDQPRLVKEVGGLKVREVVLEIPVLGDDPEER